MRFGVLRGDAARIALPDQSVDLVLGSPPYTNCRTYLEHGRDLGIARETDAWVRWMLVCTTEALRVSRGAVVWVAAGPTRDRNYQPACEGLMWEWFRRGGSMYRPCYWHRVGIPGSGGDQWFRHDVEIVMCFKRPGPLPWTDNIAMGHVPKWAPGGEMSYRLQDGTRVHPRSPHGVRTDAPIGTRDHGRKDPGREQYRARGRNQWGGSGMRGNRKADGTRDTRVRPSHRFRHAADGTVKGGRDRDIAAIANPGNLIRTNAGGGHLGHALAHVNEAPYPERLAEWFIRSLCRPGGIVLDPFGGSGTTAAVAAKLGRVGLSCDLRDSQCQLARRRITEQLLDHDRPHRPKPRRAGPDSDLPLFGAAS